MFPLSSVIEPSDKVKSPTVVADEKLEMPAVSDPATSILLKLPVAGLFNPISTPSILPPSILMFSRF